MYAGLSYHEAFVIGKKTRLENSDIKRTSIFHPSLQSAPTRLTKSDNMVTMDKIKSTFGQNWSPTYSELNAYEAERKTLWNTAVGVSTWYNHLTQAELAFREDQQRQCLSSTTSEICSDLSTHLRSVSRSRLIFVLFMTSSSSQCITELPPAIQHLSKYKKTVT